MTIIKGNARKRLWTGLAVALALQLYFVRELLAAEILFAFVFAVLLLLGFAFFLLNEFGQRSMAWAESHAPSLVRYHAAYLGQLSKSPFHRPRLEEQVGPDSAASIALEQVAAEKN